VGVDGQPLALEARHISKRFGGTLALDDASISLRPGEVHALVGENGSGKSTLIKVLAGFHDPEPGGALEVAGQPVPFPLRAGQPRALGLRFVHQDLALIPSLSVLENLRIEELAAGRLGAIHWTAERRRATETFECYGTDLDPRATVGDLRPADRALLAIVRAIEGMPSGGTLVLDEATAFLPGAEREALLALIRRITTQGASVLFVSHDLGEARLADRITVLRDGRDIGTVAAEGVTPEELVEMLVGHSIRPAGDDRGARSARSPGVVIRGLSGETVRDLSLELFPGEIVGLTGLPASGFEELPYLLYGARPCRSGRLELDEALDVTELSPSRALAAGIALVPADRTRDGAVGSLSVAENVMLPVLDRYADRTRLDGGRLRRTAAALLAKQDVRPPEPQLMFDALSGGNQQKAVLAKWLQTAPRLLLLHDPTRGVDVGARERIVSALRDIAGRGVSVLSASADFEQLARLCDRVLILSAGRAVDELVGPDVTEARIAERCHLLNA
jgi:ribose transport system ATP-binding protein